MKESFSTEELFYMIKKLSLNMTAQLELNLKDTSITGVQVYFLVYILRHHPKGTYLTELCREIGVSKPTLSALIKKMRKQGYLDLHEDPDDVRKKKVLPTEKLLAEGDRFIEKADHLEAEIFGALNGQEKEQLMSLEEKLLTQFCKMEQDEKTDRRFIYSEKSITTTGKV